MKAKHTNTLIVGAVVIAVAIALWHYNKQQKAKNATTAGTANTQSATTLSS